MRGVSIAVVVTVALATVLEAKVISTRDPRCPRVDDPEKTIHLTHPTDCSRFLVCSSGMAYEMRCPEGLEYDVEQRSCDYDYLVRCSTEGRAQVQQANHGYELPLEQLALNRPAWNDLQLELVQPQQPQPPHQQQQQQRVDVESVPSYKPAISVVDARCPRTDDPKKPIHLPRTGNCGKFMKCFGGRAYEMDCPAGLEFDAKNGRCDYPSLARCSRV
uniref:Chitin-binding type-2 domain-containing protein n=1 Tax=Anopheles epiroticus TaxID=199890 RepID=A0A182P1I6_9DIPT